MKKRMAFLVSIVLILFLIVNVCNYLTTDHTQNVDIQLNKGNIKEIDYLYSIVGVDSLSFTFEYINVQDIVRDKLGTYYFNNQFDIKNIQYFNIFSQIMNNKSDNGHIKLSVIDKDKCIYLDCFSNNNGSKAMTISKLNLMEDESFKDYEIKFTVSKEDIDTFVLFEGTNIKDASKIRLVASYEQ